MHGRFLRCHIHENHQGFRDVDVHCNSVDTWIPYWHTDRCQNVDGPTSSTQRPTCQAASKPSTPCQSIDHWKTRQQETPFWLHTKIVIRHKRWMRPEGYLAVVGRRGVIDRVVSAYVSDMLHLPMHSVFHINNTFMHVNMLHLKSPRTSGVWNDKLFVSPDSSSRRIFLNPADSFKKTSTNIHPIHIPCLG